MPRCPNISLIILSGPGNYFVLQGFQSLFKLLCVQWAVYVFRWILISLVVLDFIMHLMLAVVWHHGVTDLLITVYGAICCSFPCRCLLVSLNHDRWWSSLLIIHGLSQFPKFVAISVQVQFVCVFFFSPAYSSSLYVGLSVFGSAGSRSYVVLKRWVAFSLLSGSCHFLVKPL